MLKPKTVTSIVAVGGKTMQWTLNPKIKTDLCQSSNTWLPHHIGDVNTVFTDTAFTWSNATVFIT